jgi:hypothetical protein
VYAALAQFVVLVLVLLFALSPVHSVRSRVTVGGAYVLTLVAPRLLSLPPLVSLLMQILLGLVLLIWRRWERGPETLA